MTDKDLRIVRQLVDAARALVAQVDDPDVIDLLGHRGLSAFDRVSRAADDAEMRLSQPLPHA